ncbi:thiol:disulfide interchange protein [Halobacteroides halobius DSM 5150]|uniref:Thiol:disulfide interchange protein n=1 Tax=Halobacteroides halobius (strain ATCC 35273 / DSM 5150 / MD-1) TaxID=748449 RepID=L0K9E6_HALHC|nr:thioredoxin family protein [Halobacteroides halobius]AGB41165.1 thiol:disulfide interchange protein [Halobacteroides halobius DSM 5150]
MSFTKVSGEEFSKKVKSYKQPVLLEFSYEYCSACQEVKEFLADQLENDNLNLIEIDIANNQELAQEYDVDRSPTLLLFNKGKVIAKHIGYIDQEELDDLLAELSLWNRIKKKLSLID